MTIEGYSIVNLKNEDGSYTHGFRKIKSALDNWEKLRDEVEESVEKGLVRLLEDTELNWFDRNVWRYKSKMEKVKGHEFWELRDTLFDGDYITMYEFKSVDWDLRFVRGIDLYNKLCAIIKNGEQFKLGDKLCSFVNSYSTHKPQGGK